MSQVTPVEFPSWDSKTGLIYDDRMALHCCLWETEMQEQPERYLSPMKKIQEYGLLHRCCILPSKLATEEELHLVHTKDYINKIKNAVTIEDVNKWEKLASNYDGVFFNSHTYECALLAAGCSIELVSAVLQGKVNNGFAIIRPPGHHAMVQDACGYCFFNNVAISAKYAMENYNLKRILIVDWDVHHGQATQQIFYDDPRVLYFSIHRYENGDFWPNLRESSFDFVGGHAARGFNINVPLNSSRQGNAEYLAIFNNILLPIAYEFNPELVLISSGYDAALGCPEGEMKLTPPVYAHFLNLLSCLAGGKICVLLEGGYCISSLSESVAFTLKGLLGDPCSLSPCIGGVHESSIESILNVISVHRPFWDSIKLQNVYDSNFDDDGSSKHVVKIKYTKNPQEGLTVYPTRGYCPVQPQSLAIQFEAEIRDIISKIDFTVPKYRTGFIFDPRTTSGCHFQNHAETPEHVLDFYNKLQQSGLLSKCVYVQPCQLSEIESMPDSKYVDKIHVDCAITDEISENLDKEFHMVVFCQKVKRPIINTFERLLQLIDAVVMRKCVNGFALTRPAGHYPDTENASGYCIFNSVNIAAKYLTTKHKMKKILILDLDIGRGNSVQNYFYEDNEVLYVSLHHHDNEYFPISLEAKEKQVGNNKGKGFNVNIPFSHTICDGDFIAAFFHIILPIAYEFCPEFVLLSLGYDDGMHRTRLSSSCLTIITKLLSGLSNGKIVVISEINFSFESAPDAAAHCLSALLNEPCVPLRQLKPTLEGIDTIRNVVKVHKNFWKSLAFDVEVPYNLDSSELVEKIQNSDDSNSISIRRQSSNPVAIPNIQDGTCMPLVLEYETHENFSNDAFFCVTPLEYCPHLELLQPVPNEGLNPGAVCQTCKDPNENWVCLHCYQVYCGRFINQHMVQHGFDMKHYLTLSYSDLSVWCYACDAYIHNDLLVPIKEHACEAKFNPDFRS
ncbi:histone deacetylase 6-like [Argiope bruennichi]|uniref:Protein deacetylase HDAC6 n=1 Tax=Argiope bruennichi TaxID=94029 RepID=A0A8T0E0J9_ARGBR|nr:histone deacetylase 6-like [Argiope bruennichi]KAF8764318.1 Histone deacetylase 6 like protein [Argiope bruennichi]